MRATRLKPLDETTERLALEPLRRDMRLAQSAKVDRRLARRGPDVCALLAIDAQTLHAARDLPCLQDGRLTPFEADGRKVPPVQGRQDDHRGAMRRECDDARKIEVLPAR